jgi:hypothetical protein
MRPHYLIAVACAAVAFTAVLYLDSRERGETSTAASTASVVRQPHRAPDVATTFRPDRDGFEIDGVMIPRPRANTAHEAAVSPALGHVNPRELAAATTTDEDPRAAIQALAENQARMKEHVASVAASFATEARDQRWSNDVGESLRTTLGSDELAAMAVQNIDCRTTTCRIEVQDDGSGSLQTLVPMLAVQMAASLPNLIAERIDQPNGKTAMVLYMSR